MAVNWEHAERLLTAIDTEEGGVGFDMRAWDCGTTRCIAGWAAFLVLGQPLRTAFTDGPHGLARENRICELAGEYLGIEPAQWGLFNINAFGSEKNPTTDDIRARLKEIDSESQ